MVYFFLTFIVIGIFIIFMAIGVIFSHKKLHGSCGGLGEIFRGEKCKHCENDTINEEQDLEFLEECKKSDQLTSHKLDDQ